MKISPLKLSLIAAVFGVALFVSVKQSTQAQVPSTALAQTAEKTKAERELTKEEKAQRALLDKVLKIISDPKATSDAKTEALEQASEFPPALRNEVAKLALVQPDLEVVYNATDWLVIDDEGDRVQKFRIVQTALSQVLPEAQFSVLNRFVQLSGVQIPKIEDAFHQAAKNVVESYLKQNQLLDLEKSEVLSRACLVLSVSPLYNDADRALLLQAVPLTQFPTDMALALAYRGILTQPLLAQLKQNSKGKYNTDAVIQVASAVVDEAAKKKLIGIVTNIANKKYASAQDETQLVKNGNIKYINLLRFVNFPEKKVLVSSAYQSTSFLVKKAAALVAAQDYPELVIGEKSFATLYAKKGYSYQYLSLLAYIALRHPSYSTNAKKLATATAVSIGHISPNEIYDYSVEQLRRIGIVSSYDKDAAQGFNGVIVPTEIEVDYDAP